MDLSENCSPGDLMLIGEKVVEMADRTKTMHAVSPGAVGVWRFEIDGTHYCVRVSIEDSDKRQ